MKVTDYPERRIITWRAYTHRAGADKYCESFWMAVSHAGDSDRGLAVFFIWRETAVESDDNIVSHPSRFSTCTFPARSIGSDRAACKLVLNRFSGYLMWDAFQVAFRSSKVLGFVIDCCTQTAKLDSSSVYSYWWPAGGDSSDLKKRKKKSDCIEAYWCEW